MPADLLQLTDEERAIYEWQMWVPGCGEKGQRKLKSTSVLISRVGGLGGVVALELAAAGVGRLVLAHAGDLKPSDLNRQLLQTRHHIGQPRIESIVRRLKELNPDCEVVGISENISSENADRIVALSCYAPEPPPSWKRQFPVFGAVSGTVACLGAMEVIKWATGIGTLLTGQMLTMELDHMRFKRLALPRRLDCPICGGRG